MELHHHLSAAFRALDRKWGSAVDLDTSGSFIPFDAAVVEHATATFSSEEFLKTVRKRRLTPYSRNVQERKKRNLKRCDSFSNISVSRMDPKNEFNTSDSRSDCGETMTSEEVPEVEESKFEAKKNDRNILKRLKQSTLMFLNKTVSRPVTKRTYCD
jgi:hypothetical protein